MRFYTEEHETAYNDICQRMRYRDCYHKSLAYLLALDIVCRAHVEDIFDFEDDGIKCDGLRKAWQTGTSARTTRLAFNLWNGRYCDEDDKPTSRYTPEDIFVCGDYAPFYFEAIQIRFERV